MRWAVGAIALLLAVQSFRGVYTSRTKMERMKQIIIPFALSMLALGVCLSGRW